MIHASCVGPGYDCSKFGNATLRRSVAECQHVSGGSGCNEPVGSEVRQPIVPKTARQKQARFKISSQKPLSLSVMEGASSRRCRIPLQHQASATTDSSH